MASHNSDAIFSEARLSKPASDHATRFYQLPGLERERLQFAEFSQIDLAHTVMLVEQGILPKDTGSKLLSTLLEVRERGVDGLSVDPRRGSLLFQIEAFIAARVGEDLAGAVHTARSRIDQSATARRLFKRRRLLQVMERIVMLQEKMVGAAERHASVAMPYYTHMQQAQPGNFGHYLLSFATRLADDFARATEVFARVNLCPLGAVGLSGTGWQIDRQRTAGLLGFQGLVYNSKLGREAYYAAEIAACLSFVMSDLNDLATDLHVWSSNEFALVELDDSYCSTSSIFPQKKNPVTLETIKGAAGPAVTWLTSALATFRGEGTGDQAIRSVSLLDGAFTTTSNMLELTGGIVATLKVNESRTAELLERSWSTSSNLADTLVRNHGLTFRQAHHVVARVVRICLEERIPPRSITPLILRRASKETLGHEIEIEGDELTRSLDPSEFIRTRVSAGSVGPAEVERMLEMGREVVERNRRWMSEVAHHLESAKSALETAVQMIITD